MIIDKIKRYITSLIRILFSYVNITRLYPFFLKIRPFTRKHFFLTLCIIAFVWYTLYTRTIISQLQQSAIAVTQTYAELIRAAISENMNYDQMNVIFNEIVQKSNNPIIITDTLWKPIMWKNISRGYFRRKIVAPDDTTINTRRYLEQKIAEFKKIYEPKPLFISDSDLAIGYLVFGNNRLIQSLAWMPFLEIAIMATFLLVAYIGFHTIRITERSNLWIGLAKETAHQLGTPISALLGWVEYMRSVKNPDAEITPKDVIDQLERICDDMERDLLRLRKVTNRFSQIGSVPSLAPCNVNSVLEDAMAYFKRRLPLLGRKIELRSEFSDVPTVDANSELLEWVFENLLKNSLDAIGRTNGIIKIKTEYIKCENIVRIRHSDTGKGMSWEEQKKIFAPGYTTKKRGWGLGLTLAKRIIEDYHKGKIYVNWSQKGKGTVFFVDLPVKQNTLL